MKSTILIVVFLISIQSLAQEINPGWFADITEEVNLNNIPASRIYISDIDGDDYPDILIQNGLYQRNQLTLLLNRPLTNGGRTFIDFTDSSRVNINRDPETDGRVADNAVLGDVDNDGDVDLITCTYYHRIENYNDLGDRCECLLNDGTGRFSISENSGLNQLGLINCTGPALLDFDKDGNIDLYLATWSRDHTQGFFAHDILLQGHGDGTFTKVSKEAGIEDVSPFPMYGINIMDWNNDGWPDIATSAYCRSGGNFWMNNGDSTFTDVADDINYDSRQMDGDNGQALCQWAAHPDDFDMDGDIDFYISLVHGGMQENEGRSTIVINKGPEENYRTEWDLDRAVKKIPRPQHNGDFDANWIDLNNDGYMDLVTGQGTYNAFLDRLYFFLQNDSNYFEDITWDLELVTYRQPNNLQSFDFDLDGDDDILFQSSGNDNNLTLLENKIGQDNNWIAIKLSGPDSGVNGSAIGARIRVHTPTFTKMRDIYAGEGNFSGQSPFILNFGLGTQSVDSIEVIWPNINGDTQVVYEPGVNQMVNIQYPKPEQRISYKGPEYQIFPNPAEDVLNFKISSDTLEDGFIEVHNLLGRRVMIQPFNQGQLLYRLDVATLGRGYYFIRVINANGDSHKEVMKFLKL